MLVRSFIVVITLLAGCFLSTAGYSETLRSAGGIIKTGDVRDGVPVINALMVEKLPTGRHHFYFEAERRSTGAPLLLPVVVLQGAKPGKRLALTAAVHGDELNGIAVIHQLFSEIDIDTIAGTVLAVPGVNQTGLVGNNRHFLSSDGNGKQTDPNRIFPGTKSGGNMAEQFVGAVWHRLLVNNADLAIDLHTQTTGTIYPLFVFADFRNLKAKEMAFSLMPDLIKNDKGQKGTLETTYIKAAIPAVTFEVGGPKTFQDNLVNRAVAGIKNVMVSQGMLAGEIKKPVPAPFVGSQYTNVQAVEAGVLRLKVQLKDEVKKGEMIAVVYDPFGQEKRQYFAPHDGRVLAVATDPLREAGSMLVRILR